MNTKINWVGLAGGSLTIAIVALSFFIPWWFLSADVNSEAVTVNGLLRAGLSPLNTNISLVGASLTIPLLVALNIIGLLSMLLSGIVMVVYSVLPTKPYSKHLLGFAYKKPLILVVLFVVSLVAVSAFVQAFAGFSVPLMGSGALPLPESIGGSNVDLLVSTGFLLPFWLAIVAAGLCIGARIYHKQLSTAKVTEAKPAEPAAPKEEPKPAEQAASKDQPKQAEPPASETPAPPTATST
jgi:hypothetical protein